jgi:O-acetyl-ADP-ribose deacetylase (regulator of RNase III)
MRARFGQCDIELVEGDITRETVGAIVNAANPRLIGGGGVDGAIHRAAGPSVMEECRRIGGCPVGQAVLTGAGKLAARYIIHTAGPIWQGGDHQEEELLASCYGQSLRLAVEFELPSISFCAISTGAYGFPLKPATRIALSTVKTFLETSTALQAVRFVCFSQPDLKVYQSTLQEILSE